MITYFLTMAGAFISFILQFWTEPLASTNSTISDKENRCPQSASSFPSELIFGWFSPLVSKGSGKGIVKEDLWELPSELSSRNIIQNFEQKWDQNGPKNDNNI